MPRILISGYYGFNNTGDDTVLEGMITALLHEYNTQNTASALPAKEPLMLAVLSNQPQITAELFQIEAYNRWSLKEIRNQLRACDLLIMGGGSLLQDVTSPRSVMYYLGIAWLAKRLGKPIAFYAQGIGPINHAISKYLMKYIANKVDIITVRDYKSLLELQNMGIHRPPMYLTADPALAMDPRQVDLSIGQHIFETYNIRTNEHKIVAISIRIWRKEHSYLSIIAKVADYFIEKGWKVVYIPMHHPMDIAPSQEIIGKMKHRNQAILIDEQHMNFRDVISMIGNVNFMLGMRLHAVILAGILSVPFTAVSYDPKIDRFVESLDYPAPQHVENLEYELLLQDIESKIGNLEAEQLNLQRKIAEVKHVAQESAELALRLLP